MKSSKAAKPHTVMLLEFVYIQHRILQKLLPVNISHFKTGNILLMCHSGSYLTSLDQIIIICSLYMYKYIICLRFQVRKAFSSMNRPTNQHVLYCTVQLLEYVINACFQTILFRILETKMDCKEPCCFSTVVEVFDMIALQKTKSDESKWDVSLRVF